MIEQPDSLCIVIYSSAVATQVPYQGADESQVMHEEGSQLEEESKLEQPEEERQPEGEYQSKRLRLQSIGEGLL